MALVVAGVLVVKDGKVLMVQESQSEYLGKWNLPMGKLEEDESIIACAEREGNEETGFLFKPLYLVGIYQQYSSSDNYEKGNKIGFMFLSEIIEGELSHTDEIMEVGWFSFPEIEGLNQKGLLRFPFILQVIQDFKNGKKILLDCIIVL